MKFLLILLEGGRCKTGDDASLFHMDHAAAGDPASQHPASQDLSAHSLTEREKSLFFIFNIIVQLLL